MLRSKVDKIIKYCQANSTLPLIKLWRPILGVIFIKKLRPEIVLEGEDLSKRLNKVTLELEEELPRFKGVLFKEYELVPDQALFTIQEILDSEKEYEGDLMADLYNIFLELFDSYTQGSLGTHYTPKSITNLIASILEVDSGVVMDPCCGVGGMFMGVKDYTKKNNKSLDNIQFYGTEIDEDAANLGNMNLLMNNMSGAILGGVNTHYSKNPLNLIGKCDFVISNPPFCQKRVQIEKVKEAWYSAEDEEEKKDSK